MGEDDSTSGVEVNSPAGLPSDDGESVDGDPDSSGIEGEASTSGANVVPAAGSFDPASGATEDSSLGEEVVTMISG